MRYPSRKSPIACHAEAVCEGRSNLRCWLRFRCGALAFAWPFPRLCRSSVTNSTDFLLLFGSGRIALATFLAFLTQLLLVQIGLELFYRQNHRRNPRRSSDQSALGSAA